MSEKYEMIEFLSVSSSERSERVVKLISFGIEVGKVNNLDKLSESSNFFGYNAKRF